jgi:hypothetical protein
MKYIFLIFESTHKVLKAEKVLIEKSIKFDVIPTPKDISSECGISIRFNPEISELQLITATLENNSVNFKLYEKIIK